MVLIERKNFILTFYKIFIKVPQDFQEINPQKNLKKNNNVN